MGFYIFLVIELLLLFSGLSAVISTPSNEIYVKNETTVGKSGICPVPTPFTDGICGDKDVSSSCTHCAGQSNCCSAPVHNQYGMCRDNSNSNCPDGSSEICRDKNCPINLLCSYRNCPKNGQFCWGLTICNSIYGSLCEPYAGLFCQSEGDSSSSFKVCCSIYLKSTSVHDLSKKSNLVEMPVVYNQDQVLMRNSDRSRLLALSKYINVYTYIYI